MTTQATWDMLLDEVDPNFTTLFNAYDAALFEYQGVDPMKLAHVLQGVEKDKITFAKDMGFLIMLSQSRGVSLEKITQKSLDDLVKDLKRVTSKYGIVAHKKSVPITTPTLPRIISLFPMQVHNFRRGHPGLRVVGKLGTLPHELAWPGGAAMIRDSNKSQLDAWILWYKDFLTTVKIPMPNDDVLMISFRNSPVPDAKRHM